MSQGNTPIKRALIINEGNSDNLGDQAIAFSMKLAIEGLGYKVHELDFSIRRQKTSATNISIKRSLIRSILKILLPKIVKKILLYFQYMVYIGNIRGNFDLAIIGGGQLILSNHSFPIALFSFVHGIRKKTNKLYLVGIGVGENFNKLDKFLVKRVLKKVDGVYLRDQASLEKLREKFNFEASYIPDIVYYLVDYEFKETYRPLHRYCIMSVADHSVHLRYSKELNIKKLPRNEYYLEWKKYFLKFVRGGYKIVLASTTLHDHKETIRFLESLSEEEKSQVIDVLYVSNWYAFILLAKNATILTSGRMHAMIFAHLVGIDIFPFVISKKIESFYNEYLCLEPIELKNILVSKLREIAL